MSGFTPLLSLVEEPSLEHPTEAKQIAARNKNERYFKAFVFIVLLGFTRRNGAYFLTTLRRVYQIVTVWQ